MKGSVIFSKNAKYCVFYSPVREIWGKGFVFFCKYLNMNATFKVNESECFSERLGFWLKLRLGPNTFNRNLNQLLGLSTCLLIWMEWAGGSAGLPQLLPGPGQHQTMNTRNWRLVWHSKEVVLLLIWMACKSIFFVQIDCTVQCRVPSPDFMFGFT